MPLFPRLRAVLGSAALFSLAVEACAGPAFAADPPSRPCAAVVVLPEIPLPRAGDAGTVIRRSPVVVCVPAAPVGGAVPSARRTAPSAVPSDGRPAMPSISPPAVPSVSLPDLPSVSLQAELSAGRRRPAAPYGEPAADRGRATAPRQAKRPAGGGERGSAAKRERGSVAKRERGSVAERRRGKRRAAAERSRRLGQVAAAAALRQLGTPFSWGGGSPRGATRGIGRGARTVGFDCSGLTMYAWAQAGVRLGHYTGTQFRQGRRVALSELRQGDLVFFGGGTGHPTHVGLYLSDGVMIHAPKTGDVVRKTRFLRSDYYRTRYRGAVRPA